jgi:hypothetical protein
MNVNLVALAHDSLDLLRYSNEGWVNENFSSTDNIMIYRHYKNRMVFEPKYRFCPGLARKTTTDK